MEDSNKSKSYCIAIFFTIFATVGVVLLLIFGAFLFQYFDESRNIAYINIPGKESYIKEVKHYHVYNGDMITLIFVDGTKITTSTKNVTLVKSKKE